MRKSASGLLLTTLLVASMIVVCLSSFAVAQSSGTTFGGIIAVDTTWTPQNSPYTLIGNALVNGGATLTILPGVTVNLGSYYLMVNGTLQALGSSSTPVTFNGNPYDSNGQITFTEYCNGWNNVTSTGCELVNTVVNCPLILSKAVKITQNQIYNNIKVQSQINSSPTETTVISDNFIKGQISVSDTFGSTIIMNNNITGVGISVGSTDLPKVTISDNIISGCLTGIMVGLYGNRNQPVQVIENNLIINNSIGIMIGAYADILGPNIEHNTVTTNTIGIQVAYSTGENSPLNCSFANNNIYGNSKYDFQNQAQNAITATNNWWGTSDTQAISKAIYDYYDDFNAGQVVYYPFLSSPDQQAPAYTQITTPTPAPSNSPTPTPTSNPQTTTLPVTTDKGAIIEVSLSGNISTSQMSNVIIATNQSATTTVFSFTLTGENGTVGFSNLTIAKSDVPYGKIPTIYIDGQLVENQGYAQDDYNYYVWYTTHFSTHQVSIVFASGNAVPPNPARAQPNYLEIVYGAAVGAAIVAAIVVALVLLTRSRERKLEQNITS